MQLAPLSKMPVCPPKGVQFVAMDANLLHGVAIAHGNCAVFQCIKVHSDAVGRADLVLTAVTFANGTAIVVIDRIIGRQSSKQLRARHRPVSLSNGNTAALNGAMTGCRCKYDALIVLQLLPPRTHRTAAPTSAGHAHAGFNAVGHHFFSPVGIHVLQRLPGYAGVGLQIKSIRSAMPQSSLTPRDSGIRYRWWRWVVEILWIVIAQRETLLFEADDQRTGRSSPSSMQTIGGQCQPGRKNLNSSVNSRVRKMKLPGVISLRKDLLICPMPKGSFLRVVRNTFLV